ncbi:IclR family transcriptional regulator [Loktanella sp. F6476L]|uniref:IclR family transcriptional regulator n=1 Tax=Loktanella sp. F6476L TaxID=2926405 RepID=UPI001FF593C5|nr:IclR family transcriptional regulator [Loktanella sp. F6476L]MCK0121268.1 IclR family transcriptional regulator [Loktanella sp. F6476L]
MARDDLNEKQNIPTNMRLLLLLEEVAATGVPVTPTEVNSRLGLPKPTIHRLFATLEEAGFLQRDIDGRSYSPGRRLRQMSVDILSSLRIRTARLAVLNALASEVGETCNVATPDRDAMIYLDRVETKWPLRIQLPVGTSVPLHCTASGKMYLSSLQPSHLEQYLGAAHLEEMTHQTITDPVKLAERLSQIKEQGYSTDNAEFMEDMVACAVPILDGRGRLVSTLSIHAPTQRMSLDDVKAHVPLMHETAAKLTHLVLDD